MLRAGRVSMVLTGLAAAATEGELDAYQGYTVAYDARTAQRMQNSIQRCKPAQSSAI